MAFFRIINEIDEDDEFYLEHDPVLKDFLQLGISLKVDRPFLKGLDITLTQYAVLAHKPNALKFLLNFSTTKDVNLDFDHILQPTTANEKKDLFQLALESHDEEGEDRSKPEAGIECIKVLISFALEQIKNNKIQSLPASWFTEIIKLGNESILDILKEKPKIHLFPIGENDTTISAETLDNFLRSIHESIPVYQDQLNYFYGPGYQGLKDRISTLQVDDTPLPEYIRKNHDHFIFLLEKESTAVETKQLPTDLANPNSPTSTQSPDSPQPTDDKICQYQDPDGTRCEKYSTDECEKCHKRYCDEHLQDHEC